MIRYLIAFGFLVSSFFCFSQKDAAKEILNDLCADQMYGRGYVKFGHIKAAKYIQEYYENIGLKQFKKGTHLQAFKIKANTFPNDLKVIIDSTELIEGVDFLVDPASGTALGTYELVHVSNSNVFTF